MKIEYRKGNLFGTNIRAIMHGCNTQGVMGSGVARIIRDEFPEAYSAYIAGSVASPLKLGQVITQTSNGKYIINAMTQQFFGRDGKRYVSYDAVATVMRWVNDSGIPQVAMPMIGAGLGGGDWSVIEAIIESELKVVQPVVYQI